MGLSLKLTAKERESTRAGWNSVGVGPLWWLGTECDFVLHGNSLGVLSMAQPWLASCFAVTKVWLEWEAGSCPWVFRCLRNGREEEKSSSLEKGAAFLPHLLCPYFWIKGTKASCSFALHAQNCDQFLHGSSDAWAASAAAGCWLQFALPVCIVLPRGTLHKQEQN